MLGWFVGRSFARFASLLETFEQPLLMQRWQGRRDAFWQAPGGRAQPALALRGPVCRFPKRRRWRRRKQRSVRPRRRLLWPHSRSRHRPRPCPPARPTSNLVRSLAGPVVVVIMERPEELSASQTGAGAGGRPGTNSYRLAGHGRRPGRIYGFSQRNSDAL